MKWNKNVEKEKTERFVSVLETVIATRIIGVHYKSHVFIMYMDETYVWSSIVAYLADKCNPLSFWVVSKKKNRNDCYYT